MKRWVQMTGGALVVALGLIALVAGALAATAFSQLKSMKVEVAALRLEMKVGAETTAKLERQFEKVAQDLEQQQVRASEQKPNNAARDNRADRPAFQLTQEETQLIRSYIKASPVTSDITGTLRVGGELRKTTLLPLPSQITGQAPRLAGSRFTIDRNGAIIISLRKSRLADAAILPN